MRQSRILDFLREVAREWRDDDALIQGAALAYYALFAMAPLLVLIIAVAGMLIVAVTLSAVLSAVREVLATHVPLLSRLLPAANFALSFLLATALFGMIYRVLPDVDLGWGDVILGAAVTALLFTIGKSLVGL